MRFAWICAAVVPAAALSGCQVCPPVRAAWYVHEPSMKAGGDGQKPKAPPVVYLALVHEGDVPIFVKEIVLNPGAGANLPQWSLSANRSLSAGELFISKTEKFGGFGNCQLPVRVRVAMECRGANRVEWAQVNGTMPNYLHDWWLDECGNEHAK